MPITWGVQEQGLGGAGPDGVIRAMLGKKSGVAYPSSTLVIVEANGGETNTLAEKGNVLVVDDEPQIQQLIKRIL